MRIVGRGTDDEASISTIFINPEIKNPDPYRFIFDLIFEIDALIVWKS